MVEKLTTNFIPNYLVTKKYWLLSTWAHTLQTQSERYANLCRTITKVGQYDKFGYIRWMPAIYIVRSCLHSCMVPRPLFWIMLINKNHQYNCQVYALTHFFSKSWATQLPGYNPFMAAKSKKCQIQTNQQLNTIKISTKRPYTGGQDSKDLVLTLVDARIFWAIDQYQFMINISGYKIVNNWRLQTFNWFTLMPQI